MRRPTVQQGGSLPLARAASRSFSGSRPLARLSERARVIRPAVLSGGGGRAQIWEGSKAIGVYG